jgi:FO synthase
VLEETSLLPHLNPGVLTAPTSSCCRRSRRRWADARRRRPTGSRQRRPALRLARQAAGARLETLRLAGEARVPFTTGILIGIGETRAERSTRCARIAAAGRTCRR